MKELTSNLEENISELQNRFSNAEDLYIKRVEIAGQPCSICIFEGLSSLEKLWIMMLDALSQLKAPCNAQQLHRFIQQCSALPVESAPVQSMDDARAQLTVGAAVVLIDGVAEGIAIATQSMQYRSVQEPGGEGNVRGSREGFIELLRVNVSLVRRLIRSEDLCIRFFTVGEKTKTEVALLYNDRLTDEALLKKVLHRIQNMKTPMVFDSAYLTPFLRKSRFSFFSAAGYTERPDTAAAKICEGKIICMVNGSPFALILPYTFSENFQSMDDYSAKAYFASFIRVLKYAAFFISVMLTGLFVSIVNYTPELLPEQLLYKVAAAEQATPLPLFLEAIMVNFLLEIVREAGLRLPKAIGHSVSLVAALIVGDAAIKAGLLGTPVVVIAALTSVCAYTIPSLYEPIIVLRLLFILAGGILGPMGILLLFCFMIFDLCALQPYGIPYVFPLAPLQKSAVTDGVLRRRAQVLAHNNFSIKKVRREEHDG